MAISGNYDTETNQKVLTPNLVANHTLHGSIGSMGFLPIGPLSPPPPPPYMSPHVPPIGNSVMSALSSRFPKFF